MTASNKPVSWILQLWINSLTAVMNRLSSANTRKERAAVALHVIDTASSESGSVFTEPEVLEIKQGLVKCK